MFPDGFDPQPHLTGAELHLRPLRAGDLEALHAAASDPETWAGHPARDRYRRETFLPYFDSLLAGGTALVVIDRATDTIIGCSRYYPAPDRPGSISVGFTFLNHRFWGGRTNRSLKVLMLDHAFRSTGEVWFHIAPSNLRSQKATAKLGAVHDHDATLDLSGTPTPWMCFRLTRTDWARTTAMQPSGRRLDDAVGSTDSASIPG